MARYEYGERIGETAMLRIGASAIIWDETGEKVLLTRRTDNGRWCIPGGAMDPGESAAEACVREVYEETGLRARVTRLVGIYSSPDRIVVYADGNRVQVIALSFEAEVIGGTLGLSNETTDSGYFSITEMRNMDVMEPHVERIEDALLKQTEAIVK
jgi:8-oxo-dGTP pyrophosphatase MutT (NUDIX family)